MWVVDAEVGRDSGYLLKRVDIAEIISLFYFRGLLHFFSSFGSSISLLLADKKTELGISILLFFSAMFLRQVIVVSFFFSLLPVDDICILHVYLVRLFQVL